MWILFALIAQFIGGTSALFDKLIIKKFYPNPLGYSFWLGILGVFSLILLPFGFSILPGPELLIAVSAGICFVGGVLLYFHGLAYGQASNVVILLGALLPISTLSWSWGLLDFTLESYQIGAFIMLISGGVVLFFTEPKKLRWQIFLLVLGGAFLLGLSNTLAKVVYNASNFSTGFISIKFGGILAAVSLLAFPRFRKLILQAPKQIVKTQVGYLANRTYAGVGSVILQYAIALGIPPLVDATYNLQLIIVLIGSWIFLKEKNYGWNLVGKVIAIFVIGFGILWLSLGEYLKSDEPKIDRSISWGVTFSQKFAEQMGLNWQQMYEAIFSDLGVRQIRLVAYWDDLEPARGQFNFSELDYQFQRAQAYNAQVILVVGQKVPRWPECHFPAWVTDLSESERRRVFFDYLEKVVNHFEDRPVLRYWQVENEPYLPFGECVLAEPDLLDQEIALVKEIDSIHPIIVTDSGEVGRWFQAAKRGDVFGTTMYRRVHNETFGYIDYHLPPEFFRLKEKITRFLIRDNIKRFIVVELAAEPWLQRQLYETTLEEQFKYFDLPFFQNTIEYAAMTSFDEYYLWGVEWWYWLKTTKNHPEFWDFTKTLLSN